MTNCPLFRQSNTCEERSCYMSTTLNGTISNSLLKPWAECLTISTDSGFPGRQRKTNPVFTTQIRLDQHSLSLSLSRFIYDFIIQLALLKWRDLLFMRLQEYLTPALLELIQRDRDGIKISTPIIKGIIQSYGSNQTFAL